MQSHVVMTSTARPLPNSTVDIVKRLQVRAEIGFVVDGAAVVHLALWGKRGRKRRAMPLWDEVQGVHRELVTVAMDALPPPPSDVVVDVSPPEPALFERVAGEDEIRLRVRAIGGRPVELGSWARSLSTNLHALEAKVEGSRWPRAAGPTGDAA